MKKIAILGDLAPIGRAEEFIRSGDSQWFTSGLGPIFADADFTFVNLECPLINLESPIQKLGPSLGVKAHSVNALKDFSLVGLANNHILDHGEDGLKHTLNLLEKSNISHIGAGMDLSAAGEPSIVHVGDITVGFLAWSHHEFCIATDADAGAFPIDITMGLSVVERLREQCDFIILLYHGGVENFPYPTPKQRRNCQFLAERGVDLVICQHSHIIGASEVIGDSTIIYGQGNYCFDLKCKETVEHWSRGLLIDVTLELGKPLCAKYVPIVQDANDGMRPKIADSDLATEILKVQAELSDTLSNNYNYERVWSSYAKQQSDIFLYELLPFGRYIRKALKTFGLMPVICNRLHALKMLNRVECEAHSDVIIAGLKKNINDRINKYYASDK